MRGKYIKKAEIHEELAKSYRSISRSSAALYNFVNILEVVERALIADKRVK